MRDYGWATNAWQLGHVRSPTVGFTDGSGYGSIWQICQKPIDLAVSYRGPAIPTGPKLALYRIVQESLGNALRHAGAMKISVAVHVDLDRAVVDVADDGTDFEMDETRTGHGLRNIKDRAVEAVIDLSVTSFSGSGTLVSATWLREGSDILDLAMTPAFEGAG